MAEEKKEGEGDGKKAPEEGKKDPVQARIDAEVARRHQAEEKLKAFEKAQAERDETSLKEQNKFKELYEGLVPKVKALEDYEKSVTEYFNDEIADLSDEQKALIPDQSLASKLAWVKKAKAAGVFGKKESTPGTFNGKPRTGVPSDKWYLELKIDDPKIAGLTTPQYLEWKKHNQPQAAGMQGRGGF